MKKINMLIALAAALFIGSGCCGKNKKPCDGQPAGCIEKSVCENAGKLRHVVLFGFEDTATAEDVKAIEEKFASLPNDIPFITGYEWGTDCSPEGLQKGHTHAFFLTFASEADRDAYIVHPAHKELGQMLGGKLKNVTVVDYWVK